MKKLLLLLLCSILFIPNLVFAHQPRNVPPEKTEIKIENPEISQAFYGELKGKPVDYKITSDKNFVLYVGILVPKIPNIDKDVSAQIYRQTEKGEQLIYVLDGENFNWKDFYEPFGGDRYYQGPEIKQQVIAGNYIITVLSTDNEGKYVLAVGEKEEFPLNEIVKTLKILPDLKKDFFGSSPLTILFSYTGLFLVGVLVVILGLVFIGIKICKTKRKRFI